MLCNVILGVVTFTTLHNTIKGDYVQACYGGSFPEMVCSNGRVVNVTSAFYGISTYYYQQSYGCREACVNYCMNPNCNVDLKLATLSNYDTIINQCNTRLATSCKLNVLASWSYTSSTCNLCRYANFAQINFDCIDLLSTELTTKRQTTSQTRLTTTVSEIGFTTTKAIVLENSTDTSSSVSSLKTPSPMLQNIGIIAGVVCGISIVIIAAVIVTVLFFLHHRNRLKTPPPPRESTANIYADPAIVERAYAEIGQLNESNAKKGIKNMHAFETNVIPDGAQPYDNAGFDGHVYYNSTTDPSVHQMDNAKHCIQPRLLQHSTMSWLKTLHQRLILEMLH